MEHFPSKLVVACSMLVLASFCAFAQADEKETVIRPGDELYVNVEGVVQRVRVSPAGTITVEPLGTQLVADMTPSAVADMLSELGKQLKYREQPMFDLTPARLGPQGRIEPDSNVVVSVGDIRAERHIRLDGVLEVPNVGPVRVSGLTVPEALNAIAETWRATQAYRVQVTFVTPFVLHGWAWWAAVIGILLVSFLIVLGLTKVTPRARRWIIATCVFVAGLFWAAEFFWPTTKVPGPDGTMVSTGKNWLTPRIADTVSPMTNLMGGLLLGLGVYSLLRVHGGRVRKRAENWEYSLILLLCIPIMTIVVLAYRSPDNPYTAPQFFQDAHRLLFENMFAQMEAAMFSMIAFFIMSAAYRAFRLRSIEASILMICALIVFLGLLPLGQFLTDFIPESGIIASLRLENVAQWILTVINTPALRAVEFGIGVGLLAMSLRIWLNIERGALFD